ncbi:uncharacterized protein RAG0_03683 [Rhynchosporium agropyri]|uniref:Uncharacterized protein n=1 Tax=Rhynchosporium agropyri TaxID=914238 RepID=A0A1E1K5G3_9HELO|nr:uncharacterized protein RAG0_03683 [Rhynchosporium agropyri]
MHAALILLPLSLLPLPRKHTRESIRDIIERCGVAGHHEQEAHKPMSPNNDDRVRNQDYLTERIKDYLSEVAYAVENERASLDGKVGGQPSKRSSWRAEQSRAELHTSIAQGPPHASAAFWLRMPPAPDKKVPTTNRDRLQMQGNARQGKARQVMESGSKQSNPIHGSFMHVQCISAAALRVNFQYLLWKSLSRSYWVTDSSISLATGIISSALIWYIQMSLITIDDGSFPQITEAAINEG